MPHIRRLLPTAVLASLLIGKAEAEMPPQLLPTRDVDIIYDLTLPSQPRVRERVRYLAAEPLERVDGPHKSTTIFDRRRHEITILTSANRTFLKLNMPGAVKPTQANAYPASRTSSISREPGLGGRREALRVLTRSSRASFEHLSQHVVLLVHPHELLANDPAEALGTRGQTTKTVVNGGYRSDALSDCSVHGEH
jgi:hypothetical protein